MSIEVARPTPVSRVWTRNKVVAENLTGDDLGDVLELHSDASAWWVLPRDDDYAAAELRELAKVLDLDQLAVHDLLAEDRRAKFEVIGQARLVITNAVSHDPESATLKVCPVSIIATDRALVCFAAAGADFRPAQLLANKEAVLAEGGIEVALQLLVTAVINSYEQTVQFLEDASDALADALFDERPFSKPEQLRAFRLRTALSGLRRLTEPMRTVTTEILDNPPPAARGKAARTAVVSRRWTLISEQQQRVANAADSLREVMVSLFDTNLALGGARMDQTIKKLTGWAAILAVPTLITSFVGMNVGFPLAGTVAGFWLYLLIMLAAGAVLYVVFKVRDWV